MWFYYFLLFFTSCWLVVAQERGFPIIRNYSPNEYDNMPQVFSAVQNPQGVMYFGLNGVIMEYDGKTWNAIEIPNKSSIYSLAFDRQGRLFVGGTGNFGYLFPTPQGKLVYVPLSESLADKTFKFTSVWQTILLGNDVYFRTFEAILKYSNTDTTLQLYKAPPEATFGGLIADTVHQQMYAFLKGKGLVRIGKDSIEQMPHGDFFVDKDFFCGIQPHPDTLLIVTRGHGLYRYNPQHPTVPSPFPIALQSYLSDNLIYFAKAFPQKHLALGSIRKGVLIVNAKGETLQALNEDTYLNNNYIRNLYVDNNNYLWITQNQGIARIDGTTDLSYWNKQTGIRDIIETLCRHHGVMYVGTHQTAYALLPNEIRSVTGLPSGQIWDLKEFRTTDNQTFLLAATPKGIYSIQDFKAVPLLKTAWGAANKIYVSGVHPSRIYTTDDKKFISLRYENGQWLHEGVWFDLKEDIRGIAEAQDGTIWLGTFRGGVIRVVPHRQQIAQPQTVQLYQLADGLPSLKDVMPFVWEKEVIFGTEFGLYRFDIAQHKFVPFQVLNRYLGNPQQTVYQLQTMADGKVWILPQNNKQHDIGYLQPRNGGGYDWVFQPFRRIPKMLLKTLYIEPNGVAWIGGSEGLYHYDQRQDHHDYSKIYPTLIRKIVLNEDSVIFSGTHTPQALSQYIEYDYNTITFEFAAPFMEQEQQTVYSHYLEGFDKHWSEWTKEHLKSYTNLHEGTYTFYVKAKNLYGNECTTAVYRVSIAPPWYRTWWAWGVYALLSGWVLSGVARLNALRLEKEKNRLERLVRERTQEINLQKEQLTAQASFLQTANQDISRKNQELNLQKEEIETQAESLRHANLQIQDTYENIRVLNEIGQYLTTMLDMKQLEATIYEKVNALIPAESFGIGLCNAVGNCLDFNSSIEKEVSLPYHFEKLDNPQSLAAYCFNNQVPILMNHVANEIHQYVAVDIPEAMYGELPQSLIYVPLVFKNTPIGVITAQSFRKNAYTPQDITLLGTLAVYIVIALDNAKAYKMIKLKNEQITDSIRYAQTIQNAFLPSNKLFTTTFKDHFIISYPKDIVSGDFYWISQVHTAVHTYTFVAVVDCTGHGVPGALMSMIGNTLLNEIVNQKGIWEPNEILWHLDMTIRNYLQQEENDNAEGMDIVLCRIQATSQHSKVVYAGAKRPLYIVTDGNVTEHKGTRNSIGGVYTKQKIFEQITLLVAPQTMLYLCSDGLIDQNNPARVRFSTGRLVELLAQIAHMPCATQQDKLQDAFHQFREGADQRDDITLLGLRV